MQKIKIFTYIFLAFLTGIIVTFYLFSSHFLTFRGDSKNKFESVLNYLDATYVDTINREQLTEEAINAMLQYLDPHSVYVNAQENKMMMESLDGEFEGVGIQYSIMNDTVMVIATISGGPSEKVGIRAGDRIVMVNDCVRASKRCTPTPSPAPKFRLTQLMLITCLTAKPAM